MEGWVFEFIVLVVVGTGVVCGVAVCRCVPAVAHISGIGIAAVGCVTDASVSGESL